MSDDKQPTRRRAASPKAAAEPIAQAPVEPTAPHEPEPVAALPEPEPVAALPAPERVVALPVRVSRGNETGVDKLFAAYRSALASIGRSQTAVASDVAALALEMGGLARGNLTAAGDSVTALLAARTLTDAVQIQLGYARRSLDALAEGSTKLGEIGLRLASDATKPMLRRLAD